MAQSIPTRGVKYCFACTYWTGARAPSSSGAPISGKIYALLVESPDARGDCMNKNMRGSKRAMDSCSNFQKLQNLD